MKANKLDHLCIAVKDLDAARKIWPGIGHMAQLEIPQESAGVYRAFLGRIR